MAIPYPLIVAAPALPATREQAVTRAVRFELPRARNFIEKSLSEDTRRAYTRALLDSIPGRGWTPKG